MDSLFEGKLLYALAKREWIFTAIPLFCHIYKPLVNMSNLKPVSGYESRNYLNISDIEREV